MVVEKPPAVLSLAARVTELVCAPAELERFEDVSSKIRKLMLLLPFLGQVEVGPAKLLEERLDFVVLEVLSPALRLFRRDLTVVGHANQILRFQRHRIIVCIRERAVRQRTKQRDDFLVTNNGPY